MIGVAVIILGVILLSLCVISTVFMLFYYIIKKAVKNGVLEALYEYNSDDDFEE